MERKKLLWFDQRLELKNGVCGYFHAKIYCRYFKRLNYTPKIQSQCSPQKHIPIEYGTKSIHQTKSKDLYPQLTPKEKIGIQSITGLFLYYGRAIYHTILPALNKISCLQAHHTENIRQETQQPMDYLNTHPRAYLLLCK